MDRKQVSKKDEIILQQLEVIRTMTENNLNRTGADFWGTPAAPGEAPAAPQADQPKADRPRRPRPRRRSRIARRSWRATSALPR